VERWKGGKVKLNLKICLFVPIFVLSIGQAFALKPDEPVYYAAPARLNGISPEMNTPGFWISRHPYPDSLILQPFQIDNLNRHINKQGTVTKIWQHSSRMNGSTVKTQINHLLSTLFELGKYTSDGTETSQALRDSIRANAAANKVPGSIKVRFAFPISVARQRFAPTFANLNKVLLDTEFDEGQNSGENTGSPLVLYHDSADGLWAFGACATSTGWFLKSELSIVSQKDWLGYQNASRKVVCTEARADLWLDEKATQFHTFCRMGSVFPYQGETKEYYRIRIPVSDSLGIGYIAKTEANDGFLAYTPRNIYRQAFKLLNMPYGWGDTGSDFDCSSLLKSLFATFGINLPRNGLFQVKAARNYHEFNDRESEESRQQTLISKAVPGLTLLRLNGHIMLYLGSNNGRAYALHDTWGVKKPGQSGKDETFVINKTVVSDLYLSRFTERGSLLKRLTHYGILR